jgi:hypothetical protein
MRVNSVKYYNKDNDTLLFQDPDSSKYTITIYDLRDPYTEIVYASSLSYNSFVRNITIAGDDSERKGHFVLRGYNTLSSITKTLKLEYLEISSLNIPHTFTEIPFDVTYFLGSDDSLDSTKNFINLEHLLDYKDSYPNNEIILGENGHDLFRYDLYNLYSPSTYAKLLQKKFGAKSYDLVLNICPNVVTNLTIKINDSVTDSLDQLNISIYVSDSSYCWY